ncbi:MAG: diacylglycerol kinase family protein [Myxococcaceae bacterium]
MKTFLVVNPSSANGQTGRRWAEISAKISRKFGVFDHAFTEKPMDASRLTTNALMDGYECVAAVGGDGTINEVANGFMKDGGAINPKATLAVIPRGTGGDFRRTFGWDAELESALTRLSSPETRPLDVGRVEYLSNRGTPEERYFVNICSFGASGLVDREVNARSKAWGGRFSFLLGSVRALTQYRDCKVTLFVDDKPPEQVDVTTLAIANGRYFGGGMMVAPEADPHDGRFDVTLWTGYGLTDFIVKSRAIYDGTHVTFPGTRTLKCREIRAECESDREVLLDIDGEQPGRLPCRISLLPSAIRLKT